MTVNVTDAVTTGEAVTVVIVIAVAPIETVTITEPVTLTTDNPGISVSDGGTVAESVSIHLAAVGEVAPSVVDGANIGEINSLVTDDPVLSVSDAVTTGEVLPSAAVIELQQFKVNSVTVTYVRRADWLDTIVDENLDGTTIRNRWRGHRWQSNAMTAAEFDTLFALQGQKVVLTTTNYSDRNADYKIYYDAELLNIRAAHRGPVREDILIEFRVRV